MTYSGLLVLLVGTTGSGKGALLGRAKDLHPEIVFPISCTTRKARPGELDGENYFFVTDSAFDEHIAKGDFLEWAEYGGRRYGTLSSEIVPALTAGKIVLREMEVQGARMIRKILSPENLRTIYLYAGSWDELVVRIRARAPITDEEIEARRTRYADEQAFMKEADVIVRNPNGGVENAKAEFIEKLEACTALIASRAAS